MKPIPSLRTYSMTTLTNLNLREQTFTVTKDITLDLTSMMGLNNDSQDFYIRVTDVASSFGKQLHHFFDSKPNQEYFQALIAQNNSKSNFDLNFSTTKKNYYVDDIRYNKYSLDYLAYRLDGRGKEMETSVKGTYIHRDLMLPFMRWLSADLAVRLDKMFTTFLTDYTKLKEERKASIEEFHTLITVSDEFYVPKQASGYPQTSANSKLMDMINIQVFGCKASTFRERNNIDYAKPTREWATTTQLAKLAKCERIVCGLIEYGGVTDYKTLKEKLATKMA